MRYPWTSPALTQVSVQNWSFLCCREFLREGTCQQIFVLLNHKWSTLRCNLPARGRRRPTPPHTDTRTEGKAASGSLDHLQWLSPRGVHLHPLGSRSLITACNHLMTACPTTTQGSHHQMPKYPSDSAMPGSSTPLESHSHQERKNRRQRKM